MKKNSPPASEKINGLRGKLVQGSYGIGSKSEHEAVYLETADKKYLFRRKSGPAFGDAGLKKYLGREIECDGVLLGDLLLAERINAIG